MEYSDCEKVEAPNSKGLKDLLISKEIIPFSISFLFIHKKIKINLIIKSLLIYTYYLFILKKA